MGQFRSRLVGMNLVGAPFVVCRNLQGLTTIVPAAVVIRVAKAWAVNERIDQLAIFQVDLPLNVRR